MEIIQSASGNYYIYDQKTNYISLYPNTSKDENVEHFRESYYSDKLKYLVRQGILSQKSTENNQYRFLKREDIADAITNTHQIILEVTDKCNLDCYYCGYGKLYDNYDKRQNKNLPLGLFQTLYNYLKNLWDNSLNKGCSYLRISFYGGEPLCNFNLIREVVTYVKSNPIKNKKIVFSMTTNAVLLDKYMDFLVENDFEMLISLDGDRYNDSYRTFKNGKESFDLVISNIDKLFCVYPEFFAKNVKFNSVLHDRNSVREAVSFISKRYNKKPMTNELNIFGVAKSKRGEFAKMFHSKTTEFDSMSDNEKQIHEIQSPYLLHYEKWIFNTLMRTYSVNILDALSKSYVESVVPEGQELPTKTCIPFSRKIFVSVNGNIFPCERIGNEIDFGNVSNGSVNINYNNILSRYNRLLNKYSNVCNKCKAKDFCSVCAVSDIKGYEVCNRMQPRNISEIISYFESNPETLTNVIKNISII